MLEYFSDADLFGALTRGESSQSKHARDVALLGARCGLFFYESPCVFCPIRDCLGTSTKTIVVNQSIYNDRSQSQKVLQKLKR